VKFSWGGTNWPRYLVSGAYLASFPFDPQHSAEPQEAIVVETVPHAQVVAVASEVVPFVDVDLVAIIRHDLERNNSCSVPAFQTADSRSDAIAGAQPAGEAFDPRRKFQNIAQQF